MNTVAGGDDDIHVTRSGLFSVNRYTTNMSPLSKRGGGGSNDKWCTSCRCSDKQGWPCSYDGSGQGACSGDWTAGVIADKVYLWLGCLC